MEDVELTSPFKSPSVSDLPRRIRACSGSSASSTEKEAMSPHYTHQVPYGTTSASSSRAGSEGRDENDPPNDAGGGDHHLRVNPFEKDLLAGLHKSFCSPSILEIKETPPQRSWAIEHLAQLFPKDIENSPSTHQNSFPVDAQTEAKAQADIDMYFSRGSIVPTPSPMKERVVKVHADLTRVRTTITDVHYGHSPIARSVVGLNGLAGNIKKLKKPVPTTERWTQTTLSFPTELPDYFQQMLWQFSQNVDHCGTSGETDCSQKSANSDCTENGDINDTGKSSSSLNNSIRRRLELSFGEDPEGDESCQGFSQGGPASPIVDPFRCNHVVSTPPNSRSSGCFQLNTTTSELEVQLMRCEFTPESRGPSSALTATPGITPIHDDTDELKFVYQHPCSTPRRKNTVKHLTKENLIPPLSPMEEPISASTSSSSRQATSCGSSDNTQGNMLRRLRVDTPERVHNKKRCSASSFDDSQVFMGDSSPPAKLHRRNSKDDDNDDAPTDS